RLTTPPPPVTYILSLHDALPISRPLSAARRSGRLPGRVQRSSVGDAGGVGHLPCLRTGWRLPPRSCLPPGSARRRSGADPQRLRSEEHTSELQSREKLVCRLLLE